MIVFAQTIQDLHHRIQWLRLMIIWTLVNGCDLDDPRTRHFGKGRRIYIVGLEYTLEQFIALTLYRPCHI